MTAQELLTAITFAESAKTTESDVAADAPAIMHVIMNRVKHKGFPNTIREVIEQTDDKGVKQFSGLGGDEWKKVLSGNLTDTERERLQLIQSLSGGVLQGGYVDPTKGATNYYNPDEADPDWGKMRTPDTVKPWHMYYPETYNSGYHDFLKQTLRRK